MAVTAQATGTQTATVGTEHFVANVAVNGVFVYTIDKINMAALDVVEFRIYQMVLTAGTARVAYKQTYTDAQPTDDMIAIFVPVANELTDAQSLRFSLKQAAGTSRNFDWKILKVG